jgi:MOSC domain-containing protein YiiM
MDMQEASVSGRIFQINASHGGLPKLAQVRADVNSSGLSNDFQADTSVHGGPERALCLFSLEQILSLQAEGHSIFPGAIGENLTLSGLDWSLIQPGTRLKVGNNVLIEITRFTTPCNNLEPYFLDQDYSRVSEKRHPGWARVYARVLQTGEIKVGDEVRFVTQGNDS